MSPSLKFSISVDILTLCLIVLLHLPENVAVKKTQVVCLGRQCWVGDGSLEKFLGINLWWEHCFSRAEPGKRECCLCQGDPQKPWYHRHSFLELGLKLENYS